MIPRHTSSNGRPSALPQPRVADGWLHAKIWVRRRFRYGLGSQNVKIWVMKDVRYPSGSIYIPRNKDSGSDATGALVGVHEMLL